MNPRPHEATPPALAAPGIRLDADALIALARRGNTQRVGPVSALPGGTVTRKRGHGQEMADVRAYVAGDDVRHLDPASTARTGSLHVRTYHEERDRVTVLVADFRPPMLWGTRRALASVAAAEALAFVGWRAVDEGGRVGLLAIWDGPPVMVRARGRARGMLNAIGAMVETHARALLAAPGGSGEGPPLDRALLALERIAPGGAELVIASSFEAPGGALGDTLNDLGRRRRLRLLAGTDAVRHLPAGRYPVRLPGGRHLRIEIGAASADMPAGAGPIAGHPALSLDAGAPLDDTIALIEATLPPRGGP